MKFLINDNHARGRQANPPTRRSRGIVCSTSTSRRPGGRVNLVLINAVWLTGCLAALASIPALAQLQVRVVPVELAPLVEELPLSGSLVSPRSSQLAPQESGLVTRLLVDEGDVVSEGDVLLELDARLARLQLQQLTAEQEEARLLYEDAERLVEEGRRLVGNNNISRTVYDSRVATAAAAEQQHKQLQAQRQAQQVRVDRHQVRAPFAGVIASKMTEEGQWLSAGDAALELTQMDPLRVQVSVPERYYGRIVAGTPASISVNALPAGTINTAIDKVVPVSSQQTRSFLARVDIPNPDFDLAPGMSAQLVLSLGGGSTGNTRASRGETAGEVLQVPADAVVRRADGSAEVWVVRDEQAVMFPVRIGRSSPNRVEVFADGLKDGDLAVTLGNESLQAGQQIIPVQD